MQGRPHISVPICGWRWRERVQGGVRDLLALAKIETSAWDTWRAAREPHRVLDDAALSRCDGIAQGGEAGAIEIAPSLSAPPWH